MGGGVPNPQQIKVLERFIDSLPALPARANLDAERSQNGQSLFTSKGCTTCHSGAHYTNNTTTDVGTGSAFQVPQLVNIGYRVPVMHDGCAKTLLDRFDPSCGGDSHGAQDLTDAEKQDLAEYLESL